MTDQQPEPPSPAEAWAFGINGHLHDPIDERRPSAARAYDYLLGGMYNFKTDRDLADRIVAALPDARLMAAQNRAFLGRAVRYLSGVGIHQYIDLGSGIPTLGNVHEVAQQAMPCSRVVYVDIDPVAVATSHLLLAANPHAVVIQADLRHPATILTHPQLTTLIDLGQPVAVLMIAVLHFITGQDPYQIVTRFHDEVAPGSYLAISHLTSDYRPEQITTISDLSRHGGTPLVARSREQIRRLFTGWELVPPGVSYTAAWRPDPDEPDDLDQQPQRANLLAGIARKPRAPLDPQPPDHNGHTAP